MSSTLEEDKGTLELKLLGSKTNSHSLDGDVDGVVCIVSLEVSVVVNGLWLRSREDVEVVLLYVSVLEFHIFYHCV